MAYADTDFGPYYKYITGPDLTGLFTRSNGALGIVTKIAYRCLHRPSHWGFHAYSWPAANVEGYAKAVLGVTAAEVFDAHIRGRGPMPGGTASPDDYYLNLVLIVNGDNELELKGKEQEIDRICQTNGGTYVPGGGEQHHVKWPGSYFYVGVDRPIPGAKRQRRQAYIFDELIFPTSWLPQIFNKLVEIFKKHGMWGNGGPMPAVDAFVMKPHVISWQNPTWFDDSNKDLVDRFHRCQAEFRDWFGPRGGTFQYRLPPLVPDWVWTNQAGDFELLRSIKAVLDPNNVLSPGTFELGGK
jgi:FAD/FMN-containing dehydrogenase